MEKGGEERSPCHAIVVRLHFFLSFTLVPGLLAGAVAWKPNLVFLGAKFLDDFFIVARYLYVGLGLDLVDFAVLLDLETLRFTRWREGDGGVMVTQGQNTQHIKTSGSSKQDMTQEQKSEARM